MPALPAFLPRHGDEPEITHRGAVGAHIAVNDHNPLSAAGGGVGGFMGTTGGSYFGGFLCWWRECGVREVQVRIVVKSGGKLSRGNTGQSKDKGENLCNIEVIYN